MSDPLHTPRFRRPCPQESVWGAHLPLPDLEPVGGEPLMSVTRGQCERQTYGYLSSRKVSPPIDWYKIILLGDRGTCVLTTCPWLRSTAGRLGFEPATYTDRKSGTLPIRHRATQQRGG